MTRDAHAWEKEPLGGASFPKKQKSTRDESECSTLCHPDEPCSITETGTCEIERMRIGYWRYETARRMNPQQWKDAWKLSVSTGKPFDEIIDDMRPFMFPNKHDHQT